MAQWSKVVGAPSRKQLLGTTRGKVCLFMGVWRQVAASGSEKVPVCLGSRAIIKLQDSVRKQKKESAVVEATALYELMNALNALCSYVRLRFY